MRGAPPKSEGPRLYLGFLYVFPLGRGEPGRYSLTYPPMLTLTITRAPLLTVMVPS
jgi:hypothetical protein